MSYTFPGRGQPGPAAPLSDLEAAQAAQTTDWTAIATIGLALATFFLALFTASMAYSTKQLVALADQQSKDTKDSIVAATRQAVAVEKSNNLTISAYKIYSRPWLVVEIHHKSNTAPTNALNWAALVSNGGERPAEDAEISFGSFIDDLSKTPDFTDYQKLKCSYDCAAIILPKIVRVFALPPQISPASGERILVRIRYHGDDPSEKFETDQCLYVTPVSDSLNSLSSCEKGNFIR